MVSGLHLETRHWGVEGRRFPRLLSQPSLVARLQANKRLISKELGMVPEIIL